MDQEEPTFHEETVFNADLKESAGRTQSGNITKAGSRTLRWALCKAAVTLCRSDAKQEATRHATGCEG